MNEEHIITTIKRLNLMGKLTFSNLKKELGTREFETIADLFLCLKFILNKKENLEIFLALLNFVEETLIQFGNSYSVLFEVDMKYLYKELFKILKEKPQSLDKNAIEIIKKARTSIKKYNSLVKTEATPVYTPIDQKTFDYLWHIIKKTKDVVFLRDLFRKYPQFSNTYDTNYLHLSYRIIREYLITKDNYYLSLIPIIFEVPNLEFTADEKNKIWKLIHKYEQNGHEFKTLKHLLVHYLKEEDKPLSINNGFSEIKKEPPKPKEVIDTLQYRVDLTNLYTFGIRKDIISESFKFGIDPYYIYSLEENEFGYDLYIHIPDIDITSISYEGKKRAMTLIESVHSQNDFIPLFDEEFLEHNVSLIEAVKRPALTFKMSISSIGVIKQIECIESTISVNRYYSRRQIESRIKANSENEITDLYRLIKAFKNFYKPHKENNFYLLTEYLINILEYIFVFSLKTTPPLIYRNLLPQNGEFFVQSLSRIQKITQESWNKQKAASIMAIPKERKENVTIYSCGPLIKHTYFTSTPPISHPEISFIAIQNLRNIKEALKYGDTRTPIEELTGMSLIANACNKTLFLTRNNKCHLRNR